MFTKQILYGAAYYDEYMPASRVSEDFSLMQQAGMNVIRIAESTWSTWEPREGEFDFSGLHRVLKAAKEHGISVIVGTPTYAIPAWLAQKYPDILTQTHAGPSRYGPRQNMDLTHPGYLHHAEIIIRRLLEAAAPYSNVIGFQLDNETKPYDTCSPRAQARFKIWLQGKFGTVEAMNRSFGLAYWSNALGSWDDLPDVRGTINGSLAAEYAAFQRSLVTEFLAWQRSIVDEYRRPDQFVTHNFDYDWIPFCSCGLQPDADQFAAATSVTVAGCDIYHRTGSHLTGTEISFGGDLARGLKNGENYLVLETQAQGPLDNFPYPGQLRLHAFSHLAGGANMIEYWHWHSIHNAIERYWKGVLSHDLMPSETYQEVTAIGQTLHRLSPHLVNLRKVSKVAVMVSNRSLTAMKHDASFSDLAYNRDGLRPLYDALYRLNVPVDLVPDTLRDFSRYDLVVLPCLYTASEALIEALRSYTHGGGNLLATFRSFFCDEHNTIYHDAQPHGMTEVFGLTYDQFCKGQENEPTATRWMELLRPFPGTEVLRHYEAPVFASYAAATLSTFGNGRAAYLGADFSQDTLESLLTALLPRLGIPLSPDRWPLIRKGGANDLGRRIEYLLNYSDAPIAAEVRFPARELLTDRVYAPSTRLTLPAWGVAILEAQP